MEAQKRQTRETPVWQLSANSNSDDDQGVGRAMQLEQHDTSNKDARLQRGSSRARYGGVPAQHSVPSCCEKSIPSKDQNGHERV
jgi:hypothetical protein